MSAVTRENVRTLAMSVVQRLPNLLPFKLMNEFTVGSDLTRVIYAMQGLLIYLVSYTTSVLILAKSLLSVVYAAAGLCMVATATVIKNVVGARGSRFMKNAWDVICRLKGSIFDVRS